VDRAIDRDVQFDHAGTVTPTRAADAVETDLVCAARAGDQEAFGLLYERFGPMVHGVLLARVPYAEVDDLVQDVFLVAYQRLPTLRAPAAFGSWLAAIARHRAVDFHRRPSLEPMPESIAAEPSRSPEALAVLTAIQSLPSAYRETLVLRLVEGMTGDEIARRTGLTPASVRVNLHRGMKRLRQALDAERVGR